MNQPKTTFDYHVFIKRLRDLIEQAESFSDQDAGPKSEVFQTWLLEAKSLLKRAQQLHGRSEVASSLLVRSFGYSATPAYARPYFEEDLRDTLREFRLLIKNYEDFGAPSVEKRSTLPLSTAANEAPAVPADGELTIAWLVHKMPLYWWGVIFGGLVVFAAAAFQVGREWESLQQQKNRQSPAEQGGPTTPGSPATKPPSAGALPHS